MTMVAEGPQALGTLILSHNLEGTVHLSICGIRTGRERFL